MPFHLIAVQMSSMNRSIIMATHLTQHRIHNDGMQYTSLNIEQALAMEAHAFLCYGVFLVNAKSEILSMFSCCVRHPATWPLSALNNIQRAL
jgi:hypothetical protein